MKINWFGSTFQLIRKVPFLGSSCVTQVVSCSVRNTKIDKNWWTNMVCLTSLVKLIHHCKNVHTVEMFRQDVFSTGHHLLTFRHVLFASYPNAWGLLPADPWNISWCSTGPSEAEAGCPAHLILVVCSIHTVVCSIGVGRFRKWCSGFKPKVNTQCESHVWLWSPLVS